MDVSDESVMASMIFCHFYLLLNVGPSNWISSGNTVALCEMTVMPSLSVLCSQDQGQSLMTKWVVVRSRSSVELLQSCMSHPPSLSGAWDLVLLVSLASEQERWGNSQLSQEPLPGTCCQAQPRQKETCSHAGNRNTEMGSYILTTRQGHRSCQTCFVG
jgi:hypothetical protein